MTNNDTLNDDLAFVRDSIERDPADHEVPAIYWLWAVLIPIGFALPDFAPKWAGLYWVIAGPGGGLLSMWLGYRHERAHGKVDKKLGARYGWHWGITGIGFFAVFLPLLSGAGDMQMVAANVLLIGALGYGLAAVHLNPPLAPAAALMGIGYVVLAVWFPPYAWTATGVLVGIALAITALRVRK